MTGKSLHGKSRLDIIDTALQKEQERRALWYLFGLFFLTAIYEFGGGVIESWATSGVEIQEVDTTKTEKKLLPARRLERLSGTLSRTIAEHPVLGELLAPEMTSLASLTKRLAAKTEGPRLQKEVGEFLNGLWRTFHQPTWEDAAWFDEANRELLQLLVLLKVKPDETITPPLLEVGPRPLSGPVAARRDLFGFGAK